MSILDPKKPKLDPDPDPEPDVPPKPPQPFPGMHGNPATGLPSFVEIEGLPDDMTHYVTLSRALTIAIDAATMIPTQTDPEVIKYHLDRFDLARLILKNTETTIDRIEKWTRKNLKPEPAAKHEAKSHK